MAQSPTASAGKEDFGLVLSLFADPGPQSLYGRSSERGAALLSPVGDLSRMNAQRMSVPSRFPPDLGSLGRGFPRESRFARTFIVETHSM